MSPVPNFVPAFTSAYPGVRVERTGGPVVAGQGDGVSIVRPTRASRRAGLPDATVARLPEYLRALLAYSERGVETVSSDSLAAASGVNSAKLRKDLSYLGSYGIRGVGYDVAYLV